jgi:hypothetical protein
MEPASMHWREAEDEAGQVWPLSIAFINANAQSVAHWECFGTHITQHIPQLAAHAVKIFKHYQRFRHGCQVRSKAAL